ncbi:MAG: hypothetical protein CMM84_03685 [Rhodothermaceae bacterium]|nr:hypothetical protein [Rhodothermaceae bacterium]MBC15318.1 hypothetical protein [Rhodothermaceae bacterium]
MINALARLVVVLLALLGPVLAAQPVPGSPAVRIGGTVALPDGRYETSAAVLDDYLAASAEAYLCRRALSWAEADLAAVAAARAEEQSAIEARSAALARATEADALALAACRSRADASDAARAASESSAARARHDAEHARRVAHRWRTATLVTGTAAGTLAVLLYLTATR